MSRITKALCLVSSLAVPTATWADGHGADAQALWDALEMPAFIDVMRAEGLAYGDQLGRDMFGGTGPAAWSQTIDGIYDTDRMERDTRLVFADHIAEADIATMLAFFESDLGRTIIGLELAAREARLDPDLEQASIEAATLAAADRLPRIAQISDLITAGDMIDSNVTSAMNFSYAFYLGLADGGALGGTLTEDQILSDVYGQEPAIRIETQEWLFSYLYLAYQPLSDEDLAAYIVFSETDAAGDLNAAIIAAFEPTYTAISRQLGLSAAQMMVVQDL